MGCLFNPSTVVPYKPMQANIQADNKESTQPTTRIGTNKTVST